MKPAVYIAQLLCPQRHCISANVSVCQSDEEINNLTEHTHTGFAFMVEKKLLNPWCGICGSTSLRVETARTKFSTMDEAMPHLKASEKAQQQSAAMLKAEKN